jgi:hypothetical protein
LYSLSIVGDSKPIKKVDAGAFTTVEEREAFCTAFWRKVSDLFTKVWLPDPDQSATDRLKYLEECRSADRNVAIFLQALGQVCQRIGNEEKWNWNPKSPLLVALDNLDPTNVEYRAALACHRDSDGNVHVDRWNTEWTNAMMKPTSDEAGNVTGYAFNNVADSIAKTRNLLLRKVGLKSEEVATDEAA